MKKLLLTALIASTLIAPLNASEELEDNTTLYVMYKFNGLCSFIDSMENFQSDLKMEGADKFIQKVISYQVARHGSDIKKHHSICKKAKLVASNPELYNVEYIPFRDLMQLLGVSKLTGYCGMYNIASQVAISESEQNFLFRFLSTELIKKNYEDVIEFKKVCDLSNTIYMRITGQE